MKDEEFHLRALEICRENPGHEVRVIEAALREGANRVLDHAIPLLRAQQEQLARERAKANAPQ